MSEKAMNPVMLDYYNRHDKQAKDLPMYSYHRLLELAQESAYVPFPLYFSFGASQTEETAQHKKLNSLWDTATFTTDVTAVTGSEVIVFAADVLKKHHICAGGDLLCALPDGQENWGLYLHDVYHSGVHHEFIVNWKTASLPDGEGRVRYSIMTPEEALALDKNWRESLKRKGFDLFIEEMTALAVTEEERKSVQGMQAKVLMLRCW